MAWTLVGETTFNIQDNDVNQNVSIPGTPKEGDVVILVHASDGIVSPGVQTAGYTTIFDDGGTSSPGYEISYKQMGVTPDTVVTIQQASGEEYTAGCLQVWRGADFVVSPTPLDVTSTLATGSGAGADPPAITTVTDGCLIIAIGALDDLNEAGTITAPAGYTNLLTNDNTANGDNASSFMASTVQETAGTENPGTFGTGSDFWAVATVALRPFPPYIGPVSFVSMNF